MKILVPVFGCLVGSGQIFLKRNVFDFSEEIEGDKEGLTCEKIVPCEREKGTKLERERERELFVAV